jgi:hypothetical protein
LFFGFRTAVSRGWIPAPGIAKSIIPTKANLPDLKEAVVANVEPAVYPDAAAASVKAQLMRVELWAWNAQMGFIYANGGADTTHNSLMEKHNANVKLVRQDDTSQMQNDLIACAKELHDGASEYIAQVIGSTGYSRGEDKLMGPPEWKADPQASKGGLIAGVLRDGDWNIAMKWGSGQPDQKQPRRKDLGPRGAQLGERAGLHQGGGNL